MTYPTALTSTTPENKHVEILCAHCKTETRHKVLARVAATYSESVDSEHSVDLWQVDETLICEGCGDISFKRGTQFSEDLDIAFDGQPFYPTTVQLFPQRSDVGNRLRTEAGLPATIVSIYIEACRAFDLALYVMTGFGLRAIVETICKDKNVDGKNLFERITNMERSGLITRDGAEVLHQLRDMGNDAAHDLKAHSKGELAAAFEVIEYILKGVYIIPEQAKLLPSRKPRAAIDASAPQSTHTLSQISQS